MTRSLSQKCIQNSDKLAKNAKSDALVCENSELCALTEQNSDGVNRVRNTQQSSALPIVERLRNVEDDADVGCAEAADTIEELVEALNDIRGPVTNIEVAKAIARVALAKLNGASCALADGPASDMRDGPSTPHGSLGS
jgi:hypothetical protein